MYRQSQVVTDYNRTENTNTQVTTTYTSVTSRQSGINQGNIDALKGIKTTVKRISTTTGTLDVRPDSVNTVTTDTTEFSTTINLSTGGYTSTPTEAGPYELEESMPVPLLFENLTDREDVVESYSQYISRFTKGDLYGLQIGEALRSDIVTDWKPGMPFRYADTANNRIMAMRMDACAWGVTGEESIVVTNGVWNGFSEGSLVLGSNLVGNSAPDMGSGTTAPPAPSAPPSVDNDVVGQSFAFEVDIDLALDMQVTPLGNDGITPVNPTDLTAEAEYTLVVFSAGAIVATGGLLGTTGSGSIPLAANGSLITAGATVIDADLFLD